MVGSSKNVTYQGGPVFIKLPHKVHLNMCNFTLLISQVKHYGNHGSFLHSIVISVILFVISVILFVSSQMQVPVSEMSNYSFAFLQLQACG